MKPLLLDFKIIRHEIEYVSNYKYNSDESLNVISFNGKDIPLIDIPNEIAVNLSTVTKVELESDNNSLSFDLTTKTKVGGEQDDHHLDYIIYTTKTLVKLENDDTRTPYYQ